MKNCLRNLQVRLYSSIECAKENVYSKIANKLNDTQKNAKKTPLISPLYYNNYSITDFKKKAELFNSFFSKQCSLISNNSSLPSYINYTTGKSLSAVAHSVQAIGQII